MAKRFVITDYPELIRLLELHQELKPDIQPVAGEFLEKEYYPQIQLKIKGSTYRLYIDDEYQDLDLSSPLLNLCLVLRALENYLDAEDYLVWCTQHGIDSSSTVAREYHMGLGGIVRDIQRWIDPIDSYVSDYDFELNAGAAQFLREHPQITNQ